MRAGRTYRRAAGTGTTKEKRVYLGPGIERRSVVEDMSTKGSAENGG
jgi:hypothetical protein